MENAIRELNVDELDVVAGGTLWDAVKILVVAGANFVGGPLAAATAATVFGLTNNANVSPSQFSCDTTTGACNGMMD